MATLIRMPALGIAIANITIINWCLKEGESITLGQPLLEVETDKLNMEVPAESSGILRKTFFGPGARLQDGIPVAIIGQPEENIQALVEQVYVELKQQGFEQPPPEKAEAAPTAELASPATPGRVSATPLAKRIAKEKGVDLALVRGSDPGGSITGQDVLRYLKQLQSPPPAHTPTRLVENEEEIIPLKGARKALADHMVQSVHISPQYTMETEVDCSRLVALRERLKGPFQQAHGLHLTFVPFVVKAIARAVNDVPIVNATVRDGDIVVRKVAHVGVAVAVEDSILVPVIRNPYDKSILEITRETAHHIELARSGKLTPQDIAGGTITITNIGLADLNIYRGTAIINQPQVAIVAAGKIQDRVVPVNGEIAIRPMMNLGFTYDHRVVMGVPGARFAEQVKSYLEDPESLLSNADV